MITLFVNLILIAAIVFVVVWFWLTHPKTAQVSTETIPQITVKDGVYSPNQIAIDGGEASIQLKFLRQDPSKCAEWVIFDDLAISEQLPIDDYKTIDLGALAPGEYDFHCQMHMYQGRLIVK